MGEDYCFRTMVFFEERSLVYVLILYVLLRRRLGVFLREIQKDELYGCFPGDNNS